MRFICQILQREDSSSPSLSQLRKFILPGFSVPTKVCVDTAPYLDSIL